jgi:ATP-binding cassette subfamily G (WHITE) protein 2 (PDR)
MATETTMAAETTESSSGSDIITRIKTLEEAEQQRRDNEVLDLARRFSTHSQQSIYQKNPFEAGEDSVLDPRSPRFSPRAFAKSLLNLQARDPEKWKPRTAGFAFKDLNVYGFGSATDYQKSVGNVVLEVVGLAKKLLGASKPTKIDILQDLNGLVHDGEMLVVLGPPGRSVPSIRVPFPCSHYLQWLLDLPQDGCGGNKRLLHRRKVPHQLPRNCAKTDAQGFPGRGNLHG